MKTGPRTQEGKAASAQNARKHGILSPSPVVPGMDTEEAWQEYRSSRFQSLVFQKSKSGDQQDLLPMNINTRADWKIGKNGLIP